MSLDRFERTMVARAREDAEGPDPAKKAAARRAMFEAAGLAAAVTTVATAAKTASASTVSANAITVAVAKTASTVVPTLVKAAILVTVVAGVAAGVHLSTSTPEAPRVAPAPRARVIQAPPAATPAETPAAIPSDVATVAASDLPSARVETPRPAPKPVESAGDDPLAAEAKLLARARDALARGDADAAKAALREHDARFPRGALQNEAELLAIDLAVANGDRAEARRRAGIMLEKDPQSPWRARLQRLTNEAP